MLEVILAVLTVCMLILIAYMLVKFHEYNQKFEALHQRQQQLEEKLSKAEQEIKSIIEEEKREANQEVPLGIEEGREVNQEVPLNIIDQYNQADENEKQRILQNIEKAKIEQNQRNKTSLESLPIWSTNEHKILKPEQETINTNTIRSRHKKSIIVLPNSHTTVPSSNDTNQNADISKPVETSYTSEYNSLELINTAAAVAEHRTSSSDENEVKVDENDDMSCSSIEDGSSTSGYLDMLMVKPKQVNQQKSYDILVIPDHGSKVFHQIINGENEISVAKDQLLTPLINSPFDYGEDIC